jgi:demethylmenaquinone methyltransferase/2-methoxy-6-polyprenyl-1,4-benzoquinol methylase
MTPASTLPAYYAARAAEYERIYDKPERQRDLARLRVLIPSLLAGRDVLEIACGTGYWTAAIAPSARRIVGVDINPETLEIARAKDYPPGRVTFEAADVQAALAKHRGFDGAFAGFWWSHIPRRERRAFTESLCKALAPGAVVVVLDNRYVEGSSTPLAHADADGNTFQKRRLDDGSEHLVLKNFPTEAELRKELAGLASRVEYTALDYYWLLEFRTSD